MQRDTLLRPLRSSLPSVAMRHTNLASGALACAAGTLVLATAPVANAQTLPPTEPDAGGANVPNLGMHDLKKVAAQNGGILPSGGVFMPPGVVTPTNPDPSGWVLNSVNLYLPDIAESGVEDPIALQAKYSLTTDDELPLELWFSNSDPSGSLDRTALDVNGDPIHFNLHWPQGEAPSSWLDDNGIDGASPIDDLIKAVANVYKTGSMLQADRALDILLGTNQTGFTTFKAYKNYELLNYKGLKDNRTYDPVTKNIVIEQIWYDAEIRSKHNMCLVPAHGDFTITWRVRGLGDTGDNRELAFPIDEFTAIPMKKAANALFWYRNSWIWKWFDIVEPQAGDTRKYSLEQIWEAHTGTPLDDMGNPVPTYTDLDPADPREWLYANRKFDYGSYVGQGADLTSLERWQTYDLDQDGLIGGFLVDGTDTGLAYDSLTNPDAQFNQYGNNEYAVPLMDWSQGPQEIPHFGYDSSFTTIIKGKQHDITVRYGQGEAQAGLYVWGWREHPPRINWIETYSDGQILPSGAPKDWRFGHKWDEVDALGLDAIGDLVPEKRLYNELIKYKQSAGTVADVRKFIRATQGLDILIRDKRGLPKTEGVAGFPDPTADLNLFYGNLDVWGDRERIAASGKKTWREGDTIRITIYNDDNVTRFFRSVDFGTTDYQYNGLDMGLLDWKPIFGFPQLAAGGWSSLFSEQGFPMSNWIGTDIDGLGNPFYVDPAFDDPANFWWAGERDLKHDFVDLTGFSGPGFHSTQDGVFTVWGNNLLANKPTSDPNLWSYSYGTPIQPKEVVTFDIEMPRAAGLNNGAMYLFDPQFHFTSIFHQPSGGRAVAGGAGRLGSATNGEGPCPALPGRGLLHSWRCLVVQPLRRQLGFGRFWLHA